MLSVQKEIKGLIYSTIILGGFILMGCDKKDNASVMEAKQPTGVTKELRDIVGVTHVAGKYYLTDKDYLNEGADQILTLGSRVIKIWFYGKRHEHPESMYSYNSNWPKVESLVEGAQLPYFKKLFNKPFTTYVLVVTSLGHPDDYWRNGITEENQKDEERQFYELTKYLLTTYRGTGKTFVLQHWEGDWMVRDKIDPNIDPREEALNNMIIWINARQAGVNKARLEVECNGVHVYHAAEVNRVVASMNEGRPNMVNKVLPFTNLDLVSYSAWDSSVEEWKDPNVFRRSLEFIAEKMPDSEAFGDKNVYLGEFGWPENLYGGDNEENVLSQAVNTALGFDCPYIIYWQLYCNELVKAETKLPVKKNHDMKGFWLLRPDGSKSPAWYYFNGLLNSSK
ncbi:MAG: hypothetical protein A2Y10_10165 [Planctomycetes bacterium GWF2_41_51]|nr:MAG: hypothetical protein A2Y10_10165 [Planctomycetes bacterium GWF2_41_51]HBG27696.1 hypothetical protein [Phycisphaerales bacterium]